MNPKELIERALESGHGALNEADSKRLLGVYGIPVVDEAVCVDPDEAATRAEEIGFPVVLKGLGVKLTHKTERGLVRLGLNGPGEIIEAARRMADEAGDDLEGWLVQPQVSGRRELVAGLFRDEQFGPVVMFGLGGIFTEALDDVVFKVAPFNEAHAAHMLDQLRAKSLLGPFRGEAAADRDALINTLLGLSKLGVELEDVAEVDINPLLITPEGEVRAVDALVVTGKSPVKSAERIPLDPVEVGALFHPKAVTFVGASAQFGKWGNIMFTNVLAGGFEGPVYLVNPKGGEIAGRPVYKSVADIPGPVDLAVVTVPAARVMNLLPQFEAKGITGMLLITSGFGEIGPEGKALEDELVNQARRRGILILGPNTMGICNPHHKFYCTGAISRPAPGPTAFVAQSGNMGVQLLSFAEQQGITIRAFGGSGNEAMLTIEDALDGFAVDGLTRTVLLYIESVKNGRRFFESCRKVSRRKPVIVLRGGRTEAGERAAASHTGALASNTRVFDAACRQAGVILAGQPMDLLDFSAAFSSMPLPKGNRVAIMTLGGGWGVITADLCNEYGLEVPDLDPKLIETFDEMLPQFWSRSNPVDLVGDQNPNIPLRVLDQLMAWDGCDAVINLGIVGRRHLFTHLKNACLAANPDISPDDMNALDGMILEYERNYIHHVVNLMDRYHKPVVGVSLAKGPEDKTVVSVEGCNYKGVFFPAPEQAVKSLSRMHRYRRWLVRE
ncbi:MAG: acetate--CoA ligase family protein, partial [Desulfobacteraceae bacterium]|nr:acetate--CoA ligase family protein [Desulfobacteraceae bacterium]